MYQELRQLIAFAGLLYYLFCTDRSEYAEYPIDHAAHKQSSKHSRPRVPEVNLLEVSSVTGSSHFWQQTYVTGHRQPEE